MPAVRRSVVGFSHKFLPPINLLVRGPGLHFLGSASAEAVTRTMNTRTRSLPGGLIRSAVKDES